MEWGLHIEDRLVDVLAKDLRSGPLMADGRRLLEEQLVASLEGLKKRKNLHRAYMDSRKQKGLHERRCKPLI